MKSSSPVIIIGMSRSGTSMLTRMLGALGLFCGSHLTNNHEAIFFREINDWLLAQCSGGLENPGAIKYLLKDPEARGLFTEFITFTLKTHRVISYLGLGKYLTVRTPFNLDIPWGWKDPRNTFTLPFWLDVFPNAKVIHIYRHPMDIVNSLSTRRKRGLLRLSEKHRNWRGIYWYYLMQKFIPGKRVFVDLRGASPEEGLAMWQEYMEQALSHVTGLGERAIQIKYEDFLYEPRGIIEKLCEFTGLDASTEHIIELTQDINKSRAYAYRNKPELEAFTKEKAEVLKVYGY